MRDKDIGQPELSLKIDQEAQDLRADRYIKCGYRLVEDQKLGLKDERPGDRDPLILPARKLMRQSVVIMLAETDDLQILARPVETFDLVRNTVKAQWLRDRRSYRQHPNGENKPLDGHLPCP